MRKRRQPALRLVATGRVSSDGYRSGRSLVRDTPVKDSIASTRSAGGLPTASQSEMLPCDFKPSFRASAVCDPATSHASRSACLLMFPINAQTVERVNALTGNSGRDNRRVPRKAKNQPSPFWLRIEEALGDKSAYSPLNTNSIAKKLGLSQGTTYRWFTGEGFPELKLALQMAKDGGVCVDWLLNNVKPKHPISRDPLLRELLETCEDLPPGSRERILHAAKGELALLLQEEKPAKRVG